MIVAIVLVDAHSGAGCFAPVDDESALERVTGTVLRGPFGGTLVAAPAALSARVKETLTGFAVQHVDVPAAAKDIIPVALKAAEAFRARWERAMAMAAGRFEKSESGSSGPTNPPGDWSKHKQSADVKIRGLARSFERDGVLLIPGDCVDVGKEHLAKMVESFARDGQSAHPKPFAQALSAGIRSWPVMMTRDGARDVEALPPGTVLSDWLLKNVERVCDVKI